jgi:hypothetical protein
MREGKGYARVGAQHRPSTEPETAYKPRTPGWGLFPDQREGAYIDLPADELVDGLAKRYSPPEWRPKTAKLLRFGQQQTGELKARNETSLSSSPGL